MTYLMRNVDPGDKSTPLPSTTCASLATTSRLAIHTVLLSLGVFAGCLANTYEIPHAELARLAHLPPQVRGDNVHVIQEFGSDTPLDPTPPVTNDTLLEINVPVGVGPRGPVRPAGSFDTHPGGHGVGLHGGSGVGGHSGGGSSLSGMDGKEAAIAVLVVATTAVLLLAATEAERYDGTVAIHPMFPLHLIGPNNEQAVIPLAALDPNAVAWASRAVVAEQEGPWQWNGRRPLDRSGFSYSVLMGGASLVSADHSKNYGLGSHIQLGYFPTPILGVVADVALGWRANVADQTLFDTRYGLELDAYPIRVGALNAGVFGGVGLAQRFEDGVAGGSNSSKAFTGGAQFQVGISTRLALTGRLGLIEDHGSTTNELMLGLSVY